MALAEEMEHVLLHLKAHSPRLEHWMDTGGVPRGTEGIDADAYRLGVEEQIRGLLTAVTLLAERCLNLERRLAELEQT